MWTYERRLQYPVQVKNPNPRLALEIITQYGGPDGELGASMRYLSQRFAMPDRGVIGLLTDVGTEELGHLELISALVYQLTRNLTPEEIQNSGFAPYYVDHTTGIYPCSATGIPFSAGAFQSKGDPVTDLTEDLAAEQKARTTYDNLLRLIDDPDVREPIKFLRAREIVHFQRFGEAKRTGCNRKNRENRLKKPLRTTFDSPKRLFAGCVYCAGTESCGGSSAISIGSPSSRA